MNKLYAVGIGPGDYSHMTLEAAQVLETCDVIVGYTVYVDLVKEHFPGRNFSPPPCARRNGAAVWPLRRRQRAGRWP